MSKLLLRALTRHDEAAFLAGLRAWPEDERQWYTFTWQAGMRFTDHLERLRQDEAGLGLQDGWVPHSMWYGFVEGQIVGRVSVRHQLTPQLLQRGGHLGYAVAPAFRRQGYAGEMLRQALPKCRGLGLRALLLTCADDNHASARIIERCGGRLESTVWHEASGENVRRYWLALDP